MKKFYNKIDLLTCNILLCTQFTIVSGRRNIIQTELAFIYKMLFTLVITIFISASASAVNISGTVFEDVNYGGGAGRSRAASSGVVRSGARVELYTAAGVYSSFQTTDVSGNYTFTGLAASTTYFVRVVNSTVTSSRTGYAATCRRVMTYRTDASSGTAADVTDYVGGINPSVADPNNGTGGTFNTTTFVFTAGAGLIGTTALSVTRVVFSASNITGIDFGFNFNTIVNINNTGQGSLRQFVTNANTLTGDASLAQAGLVAAKENAVFMISNGTNSAGLRSTNNYFVGGIATVVVTSAYPSITSVVVINAQNQPGWSAAPIIELNGNAAGTSDAFIVAGGNSIIKGFVINRFGRHGIHVTSNNNIVAGCYLGLNAAGTASSTNINDGLCLETCSGNIIGGTTASDRNVISGNTVAANTSDGIWLNGASGNFITGNYIGTNAAGNADVGNYNGGVTLTTGSSNNTIGGLAAGAGNLISGNDNDGVVLIGGSGNAVLSNSIYGNTNEGIDLDDDGLTANNGTKAGATNLGMDKPVFTTVSLTGNILTLAGHVGSIAGQAIFANSTVQVFKSSQDVSTYGEGQTYLGTLTTSGANGNFSGNITVSGLAVADKITGTATDLANNTSEFGFNATVTTPPVKTWDGGAGTTLWGDANNWNPNGLPVATENINLNGAWTINANVAAVANYLFLNHASLVLTVKSGNSITVTQSLTLTAGILNTETTLPTTTNGTMDLTAGTVGFTGSGAQTIPARNYFNLVSSSTGARTLASSGTIGIAGSFTPGTNSYTITGSTINYNSGIAQTIAAFNYNNLALSNAGTKSFEAGTARIAGTISTSGTATVDATSNNPTVGYNGSSVQTIGGSGETNFYNLEVSNSNGAVLAASITVSNNIDLSGGSLTLNNYNLTLGSSASLSNFGATKYIVTKDDPLSGGFLIQNVSGTKIFPVGTSTSYTPATIENAGTADNYRVRVFEGVFTDGTTGGIHSGSGHSVKRTWLVEEATALGSDVTLTLQWNLGDEDVNFAQSYCGVYHYTSNLWDGPSIFDPANNVSAGVYSISRDNISSFSPFTVGDGLSPLPVELISFNAKQTDKVVELEWITATELNNSHFLVERSADGKDFVAIDRVEGAGNSNSLISYTYTDMDPLKQNVSYYRLKQVDFDGTTAYSSIVVVKSASTMTIGNIYPMPAQDKVNIPLEALKAGICTVGIYDMSGRLVYSEDFALVSSSQTLSVSTANLPKGVYVMNLHNNGESHSIKLLK